MAGVILSLQACKCISFPLTTLPSYRVTYYAVVGYTELHCSVEACCVAYCVGAV
jgi:hypothetical protein